MALPKRYRIVLTRQYLILLRKVGKSISSLSLRAFYISSPSLVNSRFAVVVGASVARKAVVRNRIRRVIQEAILECLPKILKVDMIVYPKKEIMDVDRKQIKKEIEQLLKTIVNRQSVTVIKPIL